MKTSVIAISAAPRAFSKLILMGLYCCAPAIAARTMLMLAFSDSALEMQKRSFDEGWNLAIEAAAAIASTYPGGREDPESAARDIRKVTSAEIADFIRALAH